MKTDEKMQSVLLQIAGWNVYRLLTEKKGGNYSEMFEGVSFNEIPTDNLNYPVLSLNADEHLIIGLEFNFTPNFLREYFHLFGFIDIMPLLIGEIVFLRNKKLKDVLGFELRIVNAPQNQVYSCRFCPYDKIKPGKSTLLKIVLKNRRKFEKEFNDFYYSSLVNI